VHRLHFLLLHRLESKGFLDSRHFLLRCEANHPLLCFRHMSAVDVAMTNIMTRRMRIIEVAAAEAVGAAVQGYTTGKQSEEVAAAKVVAASHWSADDSSTLPSQSAVAAAGVAAPSCLPSANARRPLPHSPPTPGAWAPRPPPPVCHPPSSSASCCPS